MLASLQDAEKITCCFIDLDNTLWSGTVAEGDSVILFQDRMEILKKLHRKGLQLFIISKNDEPDVLRTFSTLGLDTKIFTWLLINWEPKYINIEHVLRVTEIRPETAVFVDDNPFELHEVTQKIPTMHTVIADNLDLLISILVIASKVDQSDSEIRERMNRYRTALRAEDLREGTMKDDLDFYRGLQREIRFGIVTPDNLERVIKLLVETHRLNFNPGKFSGYDTAVDYLHERLNAGDRLYAVATSEGGYSLGLTGALLVTKVGDDAIITDGTFSCGIIGRDFEEKTLLVLISKLQVGGVGRLLVDVAANSTNIRIREVLAKLGFQTEGRDTDKNETTRIRLALNLVGYETASKCDWITVSEQPLEYEYIGHPHVIHFFETYVKPLVLEGFSVTNLGAARGEVLGLLQPTMRKKFYDFFQSHKVRYTKVDVEAVEGEGNIVANAENLRGIIEDESQDLVMAVELLEHTERPWNVLSEMTRICKRGGHLFISVPSFNFPKHEYPIDLWRIGPATLRDVFADSGYQIIKLETAGHQERPRGTMILVKKLGTHQLDVKLPKGLTDQKTGLTFFT